jgi:UDP-glucuronate 4-epimerase
MAILVTGAAGFIGMHISERLLKRGEDVTGLDNLNDYYDPNLKKGRLEILLKYPNFHFVKGDLIDGNLISNLFTTKKFTRVIHMAAQAGVRYSVTNPLSYADCNLTGFLNILEACRHNKTSHLVYASSSSVYGDNKKMPFSEVDAVDHPVSLYAATKRANELMAYSYSHLYRLPVTGLRFFTVYGPWGRPDQSLFLFVKSILKNEPINVFNNGEMLRDFTYIDDIVSGVILVLDKPPAVDLDISYGQSLLDSSTAPSNIFNIGHGSPVPLLEFIDAIEEHLGKVANKIFLPMQPGDVVETFADTSSLKAWVGAYPKKPIKEGVLDFINWYKGFYKA